MDKRIIPLLTEYCELNNNMSFGDILAKLYGKCRPSSCTDEFVVDLLVEKLGEHRTSGGIVHDGWVIEKKPGSEIKGTRGRFKAYDGWIATHTETNHQEFFPPAAGNEKISLEWVKNYLSTRAAVYKATGSF